MSQQTSNEVNTDKVIAFLSYRFRTVTSRIPRDDQGLKRLKTLQVEFSYLIDEVKRGPVYQFSMAVTNVNAFIQTIEAA